MSKALALAVIATVLAGCSSKPERPEPTKLQALDVQADIELRWTARVDSTPENSPRLFPAIQDEQILIAGGEELQALDSVSGDTRWSQDLESPVTGALGVAGNQVFWADLSGRIQAADATTGAPMWNFRWNRESILPPIANETGVLIASTDGDLAQLDFAGNLQWERQGQAARLGYRGQAKPLAISGGYIVADDTGDVAAVLVEDGLDAWRRALGTGRDELIDLDADPALSAGSIIVAGAQTGVSALDPQNGQVRWDTEVFSLAALSATETQVFATDLDGQIFAIDSQTGEVQWRQPGLKFRFPSGPQVVEGGVFVADSLGVVHVLDPQTGEFIARTRSALGGTISLTPIEQDVIAMDNSGRVARIGFTN